MTAASNEPCESIFLGDIDIFTDCESPLSLSLSPLDRFCQARYPHSKIITIVMIIIITEKGDWQREDLVDRELSE